MRINHNISALKANRQLGVTNSRVDKSLERLTSGYRINRSADDAAGMSISREMKTQIDGLEQASRNAADGISVIQTAEGALNEVTSMLQRMRELAVQAANGTNTADDRAAIQAEVEELNKEIERISTDTEFNTKTLLDGEVDRRCYVDKAGIKVLSSSEKINTGDYKISVEQDARQAVLVGDSGDSSYWDEGIDVSGTLNVNGEEVKINIGDTQEEVFRKVQEVCSRSNIKVCATDDTDPSGGPQEWAGYEPTEFEEGCTLLFVSQGYGSKQEVNITCDNEELAWALGISTDASAQGIDAVVKLGDESGFDSTVTVKTEGNIVTILDQGGFEIKLEVEPGTAETDFTDAHVDGTTPSISTAGAVDANLAVMDAGYMVLQIGANTYQTMSVGIPQVTPKTLGINDINMRSPDEAQKSITALDNAINTVTSIRSKLGAYQNRLEHSIANLDETAENMTEALSRIEDTDMAKEMTNYTQQSVLAQAGTSMLAQANERPQNILNLLQG